MPSGKHYTDKAFGLRFTEVCDNSRVVPAFNRGRLTWIADQMSLLGRPVTIESVRKWLHGEARPRPDRMKALAKVLRVDEGWLALGLAPELTPEQRSSRNILADGAINLVAALLQLSGAAIAFIEPHQVEAGFADFHAIIRGRSYLIKVAPGLVSDATVRFNVPHEFERATLIGLMKVAAGEYRFFKIPPAVVRKHGTDVGGHKEIVATNNDGHLAIKNDALPAIPDFESSDLAA